MRRESNDSGLRADLVVAGRRDEEALAMMSLDENFLGEIGLESNRKTVTPSNSSLFAASCEYGSLFHML